MNSCLGSLEAHCDLNLRALSFNRQKPSRPLEAWRIYDPRYSDTIPPPPSAKCASSGNPGASPASGPENVVSAGESIPPRQVREGAKQSEKGGGGSARQEARGRRCRQRQAVQDKDVDHPLHAFGIDFGRPGLAAGLGGGKASRRYTCPRLGYGRAECRNLGTTCFLDASPLGTYWIY